MTAPECTHPRGWEHCTHVPVGGWVCATCGAVYPDLHLLSCRGGDDVRAEVARVIGDGSAGRAMRIGLDW